ncbi:MAG TPA: aldose 1-epimerase [Vicinamibacterales bacterium]|nr:aldose 1-epimerase [Vicinamibacterales bacterium]
MRVLRAIALPVLLIGLMMPISAEAQQYEARRKGDVVQIEDKKNQILVSIITSVGNMAYEMKVKGQNILRFTRPSIDDLRAKPAGMHGIPFMGPWANRLDEQAFYANGKRYPFDMQLGNVTGAIPIHGFMTRTDQWQVVEAAHDGKAAWVTSRLETHKQPSWMKQWPFAHTIDMTYRLQDGVLEVHTKVTNLAVEPMPVSIGYHPYYQLTDSPREEWTVSIPARTRWLVSYQKIPTGDTESTDKFFPGGKGTLRDYNLDDVFSDLVRDARGRATVTLKGRKQQLDISQGPNYRSLVVYSPNPLNTGLGSQIPPPNPNAPAAAPAAQGTGAPPANPLNTPNFICFEPMAGITNALNLGHKGIYKELQYIQPGGTWQESFWIKPSGF